MAAKTFIKYFLAFLILFTLILVPVVKAVSDINIFNTGDVTDISEEMDMNILVEPGSAFFKAYTQSNRLNLLAVGVNNNLTDTIMLASWDMDNNKVDIISVPRDTYYERDGYDSPGQKKINAAYGSEGIVGTANAVSDVLFGIPINYYAVITYDSVRTIVDGIGGVPMDIKFDMYYTDPYDTPPLVIDLKKGYRVLNGDEAVQFLRYRYGYKLGDLGRVEAQQEFVKSALSQAMKHGIVDSLRLICSNVQSDLTLGAVSKYALSALSLTDDSFHTWTVPGDGDYIGETSYFLQDKDATEEMLKEIFGVKSNSGKSDSDKNNSDKKSSDSSNKTDDKTNNNANDKIDNKNSDKASNSNAVYARNN